MRTTTMLFLFASVICLWTGASRRRPTLELLPQPPAENAGSRFEPAHEPGLRLHVDPSFLAFHSARVRYDLLLFEPNMVGLDPLLRAPPPEIEQSGWSFVRAASTEDLLALARQRDRVLLFNVRPPIGGGLGAGFALFTLSTIGSAHAPRRLRLLFDGPVHLGPAILDGGGMGMGIGVRLP
jgi:hypothetical protein